MLVFLYTGGLNLTSATSKPNCLQVLINVVFGWRERRGE